MPSFLESARPEPYSDTYIEKCFVAWYSAGCPSIRKFAEMAPPDENGRKPMWLTVSNWMTEGDWWQRRDVLDARAANQIEDELVSLKVNMLKEQAAAFRAVRQKAFEHVLENGFDSSASAVAAFIKSAQEERVVLGVSKTIQRLAEMDDEELTQVVKELGERASTTTLEAEEVVAESDN